MNLALPGAGEPECFDFMDWFSENTSEGVALDDGGLILDEYYALADDPVVGQDSLYVGLMSDILGTAGRVTTVSPEVTEEVSGMLSGDEVWCRYVGVAAHSSMVLAHSERSASHMLRRAATQLKVDVHCLPSDNWKAVCGVNP